MADAHYLQKLATCALSTWHHAARLKARLRTMVARRGVVSRTGILRAWRKAAAASSDLKRRTAQVLTSWPSIANLKSMEAILGLKFGGCCEVERIVKGIYTRSRSTTKFKNAPLH